MRRIYLASPFFTAIQQSTIQAVECILRAREIDYFSPRWAEPDLAKDDSNAELVFQRNLTEMARATEMLAIIDDFDPGTIWEMGWFHCLKQFEPSRLIGASLAEHGLNLMLQQSCDGFLRGLEAIDAFYAGDASVLQHTRPIEEGADDES